MKIFVFASLYPEAFKPYYDTQIVDLLDLGHDVSVFAWRAGTPPFSRKVLQHRLLERTRYLPHSTSDIPRHAVRAARLVFQEPSLALRGMAAAVGATIRQRAVNLLRAISSGTTIPDFCLVHGLATATRSHWIRAAYPTTRIAIYYHGGEVPGNPAIPQAEAATAFRRADVVFTNTAFSRAQAIARGCPPELIHVLPVGFDVHDYQPPTPRSYRAAGRLRLFSAGRLSDEKGFADAIEAVGILRDRGCDVMYSVAGSGHLERALRDLIRRLRLQDRVRIMGALPAEAVASELASHDVLLLPSKPLGNWAETQACSVQEALLMKAIVITTRAGGVPDSIPPEMRAWCVPPGSPADIAAAIAELDRFPTAQLALLGNAGRAFVIDNYGIRPLNTRMLDVVFGRLDVDMQLNPTSQE